MPLIWRKTVAGKVYEVRRAGNSLRLYTDGTFHSQYNPRSPLNGSIWDLLILPALFCPQSIRRVLVLGVGGGAVIRQLQQFIAPETIVGVELDPVHLTIARRQFGLAGKKSVSLVRADAAEWLRAYRGEAFDLIIDDLFAENNGDPQRAIAVDSSWAQLLLKNLSHRGGLVINFEGRKALKCSAVATEPFQSRHFASKFSLSVPGYDNRIGAFFRKLVSKRTLSRNLKGLEQRFGKSITRRLAARVRDLG